MGFLGWIFAACILFWFARQHDKKMNENFLNMSVRFDFLEQRLQDLEYFNEQKDVEISDLNREIRELNSRIYDLEKPYQTSILDDYYEAP